MSVLAHLVPLVAGVAVDGEMALCDFTAMVAATAIAFSALGNQRLWRTAFEARIEHVMSATAADVSSTTVAEEVLFAALAQLVLSVLAILASVSLISALVNVFDGHAVAFAVAEAVSVATVVHLSVTSTAARVDVGAVTESELAVAAVATELVESLGEAHFARVAGLDLEATALARSATIAVRVLDSANEQALATTTAYAATDGNPPRMPLAVSSLFTAALSALFSFV